MDQADFLSDNGYDPASLAPLAADWDRRSYGRVRQADGHSAILMASTGPMAGGEAVERFAQFVRLARGFAAKGLPVPDVYAVAESGDLVLLEDLGDVTFDTRLARGEPPAQVYGDAADALLALQDAFSDNDLDLPAFAGGRIDRAKRRLIEWYLPAATGRPAPDGLMEAYESTWREIESALPPCPQGMVHGDFRPGNLMWHEGRTRLIDFQDAMWGPLAYDPGNLTQDIRLDVPPDCRERVLARATAGLDRGTAEAYRLWEAVLATQFHMRIAGQAVQLAEEQGRRDLLAYLPRVERYLAGALDAPLLAPMARLLREAGLDFTAAAQSAAPLKGGSSVLHHLPPLHVTTEE